MRSKVRTSDIDIEDLLERIQENVELEPVVEQDIDISGMGDDELVAKYDEIQTAKDAGRMEPWMEAQLVDILREITKRGLDIGESKLKKGLGKLAEEEVEFDDPEQDLIDIITTRHGWAIAEQLRIIFDHPDPDDLEEVAADELNIYAVGIIHQFLKRRKERVAQSAIQTLEKWEEKYGIKESKLKEQEDWDLTVKYKHNQMVQNPVLDAEGNPFLYNKHSMEGKRVRVWTEHQAKWVEENGGIPVREVKEAKLEEEDIEETSQDLLYVCPGKDILSRDCIVFVYEGNTAKIVAVDGEGYDSAREEAIERGRAVASALNVPFKLGTKESIRRIVSRMRKPGETGLSEDAEALPSSSLFDQEMIEYYQDKINRLEKLAKEQSKGEIRSKIYATIDELERKVTAIKQRIGETMKETRGKGQGVGGPRQGDSGADECICPQCGARFTHEKGEPCRLVDCPICGAELKGKDTGDFEATELKDEDVENPKGVEESKLKENGDEYRSLREQIIDKMYDLGYSLAGEEERGGERALQFRSTAPPSKYSPDVVVIVRTRREVESKLKEQENNNYKVVAKGIADKLDAEKIAREKDGIVIQDEEDSEKFQVIKKGE